MGKSISRSVSFSGTIDFEEIKESEKRNEELTTKFKIDIEEKLYSSLCVKKFQKISTQKGEDSSFHDICETKKFYKNLKYCLRRKE